MIKVAICGNIASGKSEVQKMLEERGYPVFDTDLASHRILEDNNDVITAFSSFDIFEGNKISRDKLGKIVFSNEKLKQKLESIIHPVIKKQIQCFFEENYKHRYAFVTVPLLFEANMEKLFDKIIFIYANDEIRLERLIKRNNYSEEYAKIRMNSQLPQEIKAKKSDYVIYNNSDLNCLKKELFKLVV